MYKKYLLLFFLNLALGIEKENKINHNDSDYYKSILIYDFVINRVVKSNAKNNNQLIKLILMDLNDYCKKLSFKGDFYQDISKLLEIIKNQEEESNNLKTLIKINSNDIPEGEKIDSSVVLIDKIQKTKEKIELLNKAIEENSLYNAIVENASKAFSSFALSKKINLYQNIEFIYNPPLEKLIYGFNTEGFYGKAYVYHGGLRQVEKESIDTSDIRIILSRQNLIKIFQKEESGFKNKLHQALNKYYKCSTRRKSIQFEKGFEEYLNTFAININFNGFNKVKKTAYFLQGLKTQFFSQYFHILNHTVGLTDLFRMNRYLKKDANKEKQQPLFSPLSEDEYTNPGFLRKILGLEQIYVQKPWYIFDTRRTVEHVFGGPDITFGDRLANLNHPESIVKNFGYGNYLFAGVYSLGFLTFDLMGSFSFITSFYKQTINTYYMFAYLRALTSEMSAIKELYQLVNNFYKKYQDIDQIPEFIIYKKYITNSFYQKVLNEINSWKMNILSSLKHVINFASPGLFAFFYFEKIKKNKLFEISEDFANALMMTLCKDDLLKRNENKDSYFVSIPEITVNQGLELNIQDFWCSLRDKKDLNATYSSLNSISLDAVRRNILLISAFMSGKTVVMGNILQILLLSNSGLVSAASCKFSRFKDILQNINLDQEFGEGISKGGGEIRAFETIKNKVNEERDGYVLNIVDEAFSGLNREVANNIVMNEIPYILQNPKCITILSTHAFELRALLKDPSNGLIPYFMFIKFDSQSNKFKRTFQILEETPENRSLNFYLNDKDITQLYYSEIKKYLQRYDN
jgi:hypothetical protein